MKTTVGLAANKLLGIDMTVPLMRFLKRLTQVALLAHGESLAALQRRLLDLALPLLEQLAQHL